MKEVVRIMLAAILITCFINSTVAQKSIPAPLKGDSLLKEDSINYLRNFSKNKHLPAGYEQEAIVALSHFPELIEVPINFKVKKSYETLKTKPSFWSMFKAKKHRSYVITISNQTIEKLDPITMAHLPESARIGIIGHELSHVADFSGKTTWQSFKSALGHVSKRYVDSLEFHTDKICIDHCLGKELESWSSFIRITMNTKYWRGADFVNKKNDRYERYMNPSTIEKFMNSKGSACDSAITNAY